MKHRFLHIISILLLGSCSISLKGQEQAIRMNVLPEGYYRAQVEGKDTIATITLRSRYHSHHYPAFCSGISQTQIQEQAGRGQILETGT